MIHVLSAYVIISCIFTLSFGYVGLFQPMEDVMEMAKRVSKGDEVRESQLVERVMTLRDVVNIDPSSYTLLILVILLLFSPLIVIVAKFMK